MNAQDSQFMARALRLAERGNYTTSPNPRVGCVLVKGGEPSAAAKIIAEAWHQKAGQGHAEILALQMAGEKAKGATCYVSLEPCNHTGRTGPCTEALIEAGIARVVYAMEDPNPQVGGAGVARLREAGIEVDGPLMNQEAARINMGYVKRMATGRPFIRVKMAMSLDGRTAMPDGNAFWITGPRARMDVQRLRARSCAILTGWRSAAMDKSQMTVRADEFEIAEEGLGERQPLRVLVDSKLQMEKDARFFQAQTPVLVANLSRDGSGAEESESHISYLKIEEAEGHVDLTELVEKLGDRGINELLVETGSELSGAFLRAGLVDELIIYMAPKLMGSDARALFELPLQKMTESLPLHIKEVRQLGGDLRITASPEME